MAARLLHASKAFGTERGFVPCLVGGLLGGLTHPLLDGIMHPDVMPFMPFASQNPFLGMFELGALHLLCVVAGIGGLALLGLRAGISSGQDG